MKRNRKESAGVHTRVPPPTLAYRPLARQPSDTRKHPHAGFRQPVSNAVVTCEMKLFWNNFWNNFSVFVSHVTTDGGYLWTKTLKLFQNYSSVLLRTRLKLFQNHFSSWNYFTIIISATVNRSENILCMQDYKSLCAAATIYATLVNIQTHTDTHTDIIFTSLYEQRSQPS